MRLLLDTNVILDVALNRPGLAEESGSVLRWCEDHPQAGGIAWHSLATLWYLLSRAGSNRSARKFVGELLRFLVVEGGKTEDAVWAAESGITDFEDAMVVATARNLEVAALVTRNLRDFRKADVAILSPADFLAEIAAN